VEVCPGQNNFPFPIPIPMSHSLFLTRCAFHLLVSTAFHPYTSTNSGRLMCRWSRRGEILLLRNYNARNIILNITRRKERRKASRERLDKKLESESQSSAKEAIFALCHVLLPLHMRILYPAGLG
jgi:hypothetical protein